MDASFDGARKKMAQDFNALAEVGFTKEQMAAAESFRATLQIMLLMSCSKCQDDCHDLSRVIQLKPVDMKKG